MKRFSNLLGLLGLMILKTIFTEQLCAAPTTNEVATPKTVADRLIEYGEAARTRLKPHFDRAGISYPPKELVFVGLKQEKVLEICAKQGTNGFTFVRAYPVLAASGVAGPKLHEGDRQVPEGIYGLNG